ncbi:MAG: PP2C family protein-serine/threonine phosphatase [Aquihabitans sp.]
MAIDVRWGSASHPGRVRDHNEDAVLAGPDVFAVADGMGGHAGGEVASALAVASLAALDGLLGAADPVAAVADALARTNADIVERSRADARLAGMGTTVAGIARTSGRSVVLFHLGDTRVYRLRGGDLAQLTEDHSVVGELVRSGAITEDEARRHPHRSVVTRALGVGDVIEPVVTRLGVELGDCFLVASDGLFNEVARADIARILAEPGPVEQRARALLDAALAGGGRDNVSVVVVATAGTTSSDHLDVDTSPSRHPARLP